MMAAEPVAIDIVPLDESSGADSGLTLNALVEEGDSPFVLAHPASVPLGGPAVAAAAAELLAGDLRVALLSAVLVDRWGVPHPMVTDLTLVGHPAPAGPAPTERRISLVPGPVWIARRSDLIAVGGIDPDLVPPFAAIDLAWKLWLAGRDVVVDPGFVVAAPSMPATVEPTGHAAVRAEVDAFSVLYRSLDRESLAAVLPATVLLSRARLAARDATLDPDAAVRQFPELIRSLERERCLRQDAAARPPAELRAALGDSLAPDCPASEYVAAHAEVLAALPGRKRFAGRLRIVVATADSISARMAGPAIRAWRIAEELAVDHEVRLASTSHADRTSPSFEVSHVERDDIAALVEWSDVFVFQGWVLAGHPSLARRDRIFVVDVYDPLHLEQLEQARDEGELERRNAVRNATAVLNEQLMRGDFFLCASDRQRDLWMGSLASLGRINPATYDEDPALAALLAIVPFGISDEPPTRSGPALRGVVPGIGEDDEIILWGGGVYNWFDPITLVRAVDRLRARRPKVRLVFLGMRHPNAEIPEMRVATETRRLADELGLTGVHVFFNEQWVPFEERQNYLLDADLAVTTHFHHVETEFSFRTRVLDYFWAGLPTVATEGDALADLIERCSVGITVPPQDIPALEEALFTLLTDDELRASCRRHLEEVVPALRWSAVLQPLATFCRAPRRAPDLLEGLVTGVAAHPVPLVERPPPRRLRDDLRLVSTHFREGGPRLVLGKLRSRSSHVWRRVTAL